MDHLGIVSGFIGIYKYKEVYKDRYEVNYTDFLIKEYIREGEDFLKREVKGTLAIFAIFAVLMALF